MEDTTEQFWQMVEHYNVEIIVMLTKSIENDVQKCHTYFPIGVGKEMYLDSFGIRNAGDENVGLCQKRKFELVHVR
jgi:protein tyrosine phosphatase